MGFEQPGLPRHEEQMLPDLNLPRSEGRPIKRIRHKLTYCVCAVCGGHFAAYSVIARTCSEACRKRLSRQRIKARLPVDGATRRDGSPTSMSRGDPAPGSHDALLATAIGRFLRSPAPHLNGTVRFQPAPAKGTP